MILQVKIELSEEELKILASRSEMLREDPRKRWRLPEYKEHARLRIRRLVANDLGRDSV